MERFCVSASGLYDAMAPLYREYAERKIAYLSAVDRFVIEHAPLGPAALLDVGAGDGVRGMALAKALNADTTILADPSVEMIVRCRLLRPTDVWLCEAQNLPQTGTRFDLILCLWNVLGHLPDRENRVQGLRAMGNLLAPGGAVFFDVNNRQNARNYGRWRVLGRVLLDAIAPDERRGDGTFQWKIGEQTLPAMGHLFTPAEIEGIIEDSGLSIIRRVSVDYTTGAISSSRWGGQLLYQLGKK
jgi:2-polyprenyl-3-methyl-5-hydroxy-6-metoxy-1,4-benzoquinol methylase